MSRRGPRSTTVNRALHARQVIELVAGARRRRSVDHRHVGDPVDDALARLAEPLVTELTGGHPERIRICANDTCRWVFYDASRTGAPPLVRHVDLRQPRQGGPPPGAREDRAGRGDAGDLGCGFVRGPAASELAAPQPRSSSGRTSVARRVIDSSSCGDGKPAMRWR